MVERRDPLSFPEVSRGVLEKKKKKPEFDPKQHLENISIIHSFMRYDAD